MVSGKVQGVFYRQKTYEKANELEIKGWVRNLENGDVECLLIGEEDDVEALCQWLHQGPPAARVTAVKIEEAPMEDLNQFIIQR